MQMHIFNLISSPSGKQPGDIYLASVILTGSGVRIECYDQKLKGQLEEIFALPIVKRVAVGKKSGLFSHRDEAVQPFTEDFFEEVLFTLHRHNLAGRILQ